MHTGMIHLWRTGKRALAVTLIGLVVGLLAVSETTLAASYYTSTGVHLMRPADGVGDSPVMP